MTTINVKGTIINSESAWIYDLFGIPATTAEQFKAQLAAAEDDVLVEINSPGGYVAPAAEIYEAIRTYAGNIECRVVGQAASAASIIACAAKSSITPMGTLFLHNCIGSAEGNHNDMRQAAQTMESIDENIMEAYRAKTGLSDGQLYRLMEKNTTLSAKKAVELGFIDKITESAADAAQSSTGIVAGIAAGAPGFVDLMAIDNDRLVAMREIYEKSKRDESGGGESTMDTDETLLEEAAIDEDATAEETEEVEEVEETEVADEIEADAEAEPEEPDDAEADSGNEPDPEPEVDQGEGDYEAGVRDERARVAAIMDIADSVPADMLRAALFDAPVSAEQLALNAIKAESATRSGYMDKARADATASNSAQVAAEVADSEGNEELQAIAAKMKERY